jgi:hypothetical protein
VTDSIGSIKWGGKATRELAAIITKTSLEYYVKIYRLMKYAEQMILKGPNPSNPWGTVHDRPDSLKERLKHLFDWAEEKSAII